MAAESRVRRAAVAGSFYPGDAGQLGAVVDNLLTEARRSVPAGAPVPKALIGPHAGYVYSGPIAASAYARLEPAKGRITRGVLVGPAHRVWFEGLALPGADRLDTPLGQVRASGAVAPSVITSARAHADEHS